MEVDETRILLTIEDAMTIFAFLAEMVINNEMFVGSEEMESAIDQARGIVMQLPAEEQALAQETLYTMEEMFAFLNDWDDDDEYEIISGDGL